MAIDRTLAERAVAEQVAIYRLYRWDVDTVSFGANESARRTWNRAALEAAGIASVRRPTGGRGVWHDHSDLTYALTAPVAMVGGLREAYRAAHQQLADALRTLGCDAALASPAGQRPTLNPGACFDVAIGGEVIVGGRKVIGSAQALLAGAVLQHGAIAMADRGVRLSAFSLASLQQPVLPAPSLPSAEAVTDAILREWRRAGARELDPQEIATYVAAAASHQFRFRDPEWTWRR